MKTKIIGTGLSGLVGSRVAELLESSYDFEDISRKTGIDITNEEEVFNRIRKTESKIVLHFAAKTNVDGCEEDRHLGENGEAWLINVVGTKNVVNACQKTEKHLIAISTDFVFSGEDTPKNGYKEEDKCNPINWYGKTKYEAEEIIKNSKISWTILRIGFPYRANFPKNDFMRTFKSRFEQNMDTNVVNDQIFTPTFIDDIAVAIDMFIKDKLEGIYHVVGGDSLSVFDATVEIADVFNLDKKLIHPTTGEEFFKGKAQRPYNLKVNNDRIEKLGIKMKSFEEGLNEIRRQLG